MRQCTPICPVFAFAVAVLTCGRIVLPITSSAGDLSVMSQIMSQISTTAATSLRFQAIFQVALKSYQKRTKKDLIAHPLASQLQLCDSSSALLAVLRGQVQEFDQACSGDERLTKWLVPHRERPVRIFCRRLRGHQSSKFRHMSQRKPSDMYFVGVFACESDLCRHRCLPFSEQPRVLRRAKIVSQSSSSASDSFSNGSKPIQR
ncbi:hypothetical protein EDB86DRAFT_2250598 [Lactarius hatsudake]|nr:hypothetical protein EDB86DRAFT_2250598 [Lactarius hatsudake]